MASVEKCPKCGEEKPLRGFPWHVKHCKGTLDASIEDDKKDQEVLDEKIIESHSSAVKTKKKLGDKLNQFPGIEAVFGMLDEINCEKPRAVAENKKNDIEARCPKCKCAVSVKMVKTTNLIFNNYHCKMCGNDFKINVESGEYLPG